MPARNKSELYPFHEANIHENRMAARVARALPLLLFLGNATCVVSFLAWRRELLFFLAFLLNVGFWAWLMRLACYSVHATYFSSHAAVPASAKRPKGLGEDVTHYVVLPNYKEDEKMMADTIRSLTEATDGQSLRVILAMERREGGVGLEKAERLREKFGRSVAEIVISLHPDDLSQEHADGTASPEVAGKASNLKWAVATAQQRVLMNNSINPEDVLLHVADADCLLHPSYFAQVTQEFVALRRTGDHQRSMWQAPQLPYRNYYASPAPSRIWGYVSSLFEFGGVASLRSGGQHMLFSAYSVPLQLAVDAELWDADVITEDHHAFLKAFFYSLRESGLAKLEAAQGKVPTGTHTMKRQPLMLHPVLLPVKATSVASDEGIWKGWAERWQQAKRHAQGVAEFSYAILAAWDMMTSMPREAWDFRMITSLIQVFGRLFCVHLLPTCQVVAMTALAIHWYCLGLTRPECESILRTPYALLHSGTLQASDTSDLDRLSLWSPGECVQVNRLYALLLFLPAFSVASFACVNYMLLSKYFLDPPQDSSLKDKFWTNQRGGVKPLCGSKRLMMALLVGWDCLILAGPIMLIYGVIPSLMAYVRVCISGNNYEYVTATKSSSTSGAESMIEEARMSDYGTTADGNSGRSISADNKN
mmetsp:Transcript_22844/g.52291  ORF Transcript_22844/g.52291 Transcript_22844/m.52291 type:complete len:649 (+) Transcript_22844:135-2081(+)